MFKYILRRVLYAIPIILGVNILTFSLFFIVNSPDNMARMHLGGKYITTEAITDWKKQHGYNKELFFAKQEQGFHKITQTIFWQKSITLIFFEFGLSDKGVDVGAEIKQRMLPSLALAIPTLLLGLFLNITFALIMAFFSRNVFRYNW